MKPAEHLDQKSFNLMTNREGSSPMGPLASVIINVGLASDDDVFPDLTPVLVADVVHDLSPSVLTVGRERSELYIPSPEENPWCVTWEFPTATIVMTFRQYDNEHLMEMCLLHDGCRYRCRTLRVPIVH